MCCRFLVHRYSVLQQHVEANATDEMDEPLETEHTQNGKIVFHDDSDEVQRITHTNTHTLQVLQKIVLFSLFFLLQWRIIRID